MLSLDEMSRAGRKVGGKRFCLQHTTYGDEKVVDEATYDVRNLAEMIFGKTYVVCCKEKRKYGKTYVVCWCENLISALEASYDVKKTEFSRLHTSYAAKSRNFWRVKMWLMNA